MLHYHKHFYIKFIFKPYINDEYFHFTCDFIKFCRLTTTTRWATPTAINVWNCVFIQVVYNYPLPLKISVRNRVHTHVFKTNMLYISNLNSIISRHIPSLVHCWYRMSEATVQARFPPLFVYTLYMYIY